MIDPISLTEGVQKAVCRVGSKKYYRFRKARFYGGVATADCMGCNLRCAYCWSQKKVWHHEKFGDYYTPYQVGEKLLNMNVPLIRVSGGEPTICKDHLLELLRLIPENKVFILETNGILLDENYVKDFSKFKNIYVRISLKGVDEPTFEQITGAAGRFFKNQLHSLELLEKYGIDHRAALLVDLFTEEQIASLGIPDLEYETLITYPFVMKGLKKRGITLKIRNLSDD
ncbi:MAG: radical SAM protein [Promethearchaeota archaeon]